MLLVFVEFFDIWGFCGPRNIQVTRVLGSWRLQYPPRRGKKGPPPKLLQYCMEPRGTRQRTTYVYLKTHRSQFGYKSLQRYIHEEGLRVQCARDIRLAGTIRGNPDLKIAASPQEAILGCWLGRSAHQPHKYWWDRASKEVSASS